MKKGFTLSELLIVLGIIGVIAVLTLPNIIKGTHKKTNTAVLQSTFSMIADSIEEAMAEQGIRDWTDRSFSDSDKAEVQDSLFLNRYLNVVKDCGTSSGDCFASSYKDISGSVLSGIFSDYNAFVKLKNGASVAFSSPGSSDGRIMVTIDVNGLDKPNIAGRDLFVLTFNTNGDISPMGIKEDDVTFEGCAKFENYGTSCFLYLQRKNWEFDY